MPNDFLVGCGLCHIPSMTTVRHRNISPSIWYHCMSSRDINMPYSFGTSVNVAPSVNTPYDIQDTYNYIKYNYTDIQFHKQGTNVRMSCPHLQHSWFMSWSWHVCCSLSASSKQTEPVQHQCFWNTCGTIGCRVISCSEKMNHCPLILAGQIHQLVHHL